MSTVWARKVTRAQPVSRSKARPTDGQLPTYTLAVSEHEVDMIVARLRDELKASAADGDERGSAWAARAQAEHFWAVTVDRPFLFRPGAWGRIRCRRRR